MNLALPFTWYFNYSQGPFDEAASLTYYFWFLIEQAANDCDLEPVAYEFFTQAYILYEEEVSVSWFDSHLFQPLYCFI
jgi:hypothetical protein